MNFFNWIPALSSSVLLAGVLWLARNLISTRLTKSVEYEFNRKLEELRGQMRHSEELLKAELRTKEVEISSLRSGALSALASRQMALDKRRLEAVDQLWTTINALSPARSIAAMMSVIDFKKAANESKSNPKAREAFEMMGANFDIKSIDFSGAAKARPFLTPMVWANYSALLAVLMHGTMRYQMLKGGLGMEDFLNHNAVSKLIKTVLPYYSNYLDENGPNAYYYALEPLDAQLLVEIQNMLTGVEADKAGISQAAEIVRQSNDLIKQSNVVDGASTT